MDTKAAICTLLLFAQLICSSLVWGEEEQEFEEQVYVESAITQPANQRHCAELNNLGILDDCTRSNLDWRLRYQLSPDWGVETVITDLGRVELMGHTRSLEVPAQVDARGVGIALTHTLASSQTYRIYSKLGSFVWAVANGRTPAGDLLRIHDGQADVQFGMGARVSLHKQLSMRFDWEQYGDLGANKDRQTMSRVSAKVEFKF